jgi:hypothetical protein
MENYPCAYLPTAFDGAELPEMNCLCLVCGEHEPFCACTRKLPSSELGAPFVTSEENELANLILAARDEMNDELRLSVNVDEQKFQESGRNPCFLRLWMVLGASQVRKAAHTPCCEVRRVGKEASPAPPEVNSVAEDGFFGPLEMSKNPLGGYFSGLEDKAIRAIDAAARAHTTKRIDATRDFDEFISLTTKFVPVNKTIPMMKFIQGLCRQVLKEKNPTKLRNPSAGLSSKASKFGRAFVIQMRQAHYEHVLNFLAEKGVERPMEPGEKQGNTMMKRGVPAFEGSCGQNVWARKVREGGAARIFKNTRAQARDEARRFALSKTGKKGCIHSSNHLSSSVSEKMFQLYFKHTGDLYKEIVQEFETM